MRANGGKAALWWDILLLKFPTNPFAAPPPPPLLSTPAPPPSFFLNVGTSEGKLWGRERKT